MKALTVRQPKASLIVRGLIQHHVEDWGVRWRGRVAIHAAAVPFSHHDLAVWTEDELIVLLQAFGVNDIKDLLAAIDDFPRNAVVGTVEVFDCVRIHGPATAACVSPLERALEDYRPGCVEWFFREPHEYADPFPIPGGMGLWDLAPRGARP